MKKFIIGTITTVMLIILLLTVTNPLGLMIVTVVGSITIFAILIYLSIKQNKNE